MTIPIFPQKANHVGLEALEGITLFSPGLRNRSLRGFLVPGMQPQLTSEGEISLTPGGIPSGMG